jgi:hypothetical protein
VFILPRLPAYVREAEKVKRFAAAPPRPFASGGRSSSELDEASFGGVQLQSKLL